MHLNNSQSGRGIRKENTITVMHEVQKWNLTQFIKRGRERSDKKSFPEN
jgi:hypothetical protein